MADNGNELPLQRFAMTSTRAGLLFGVPYSTPFMVFGRVFRVTVNACTMFKGPTSLQGAVGEEQRKLYFEAFKHLSTINVAAALVVLAIYREVYWEVAALILLQVFVPMCGFGISLLLSLYGV